ncbi:MAG TPA: hypothetical protein VNI01_16245 [Elusimicrobiota bacterium]|nr:hypothetical protein [Elusimicrobiota bacterium]
MGALLLVLALLCPSPARADDPPPAPDPKSPFSAEQFPLSDSETKAIQDKGWVAQGNGFVDAAGKPVSWGKMSGFLRGETNREIAELKAKRKDHSLSPEDIEEARRLYYTRLPLFPKENSREKIGRFLESLSKAHMPKSADGLAKRVNQGPDPDPAVSLGGAGLAPGRSAPPPDSAAGDGDLPPPPPGSSRPDGGTRPEDAPPPAPPATAPPSADPSSAAQASSDSSSDDGGGGDDSGGGLFGCSANAAEPGKPTRPSGSPAGLLFVILAPLAADALRRLRRRLSA